MNLIDIMDRPIAFQRPYVALTGSINAALFLSQACYWTTRGDSEGWFFKKQSEWQDETGLTRREQETARKTLKELGILEESLEGIPAQLFYRVNQAKLKAGLSATPSPVRRKETSQHVGNRQTIDTEITSESTTDIKKPSPKVFKRPEASEAIGYGKEIGLTEKDVERWFDHHDAKGWMLGRNKVVCWKATLRTWRGNKEKFDPSSVKPTSTKPAALEIPFWGHDLNLLVQQWEAHLAGDPGGCTRSPEYLRRMLSKAATMASVADVRAFLDARAGKELAAVIVAVSEQTEEKP